MCMQPPVRGETIGRLLKILKILKTGEFLVRKLCKLVSTVTLGGRAALGARLARHPDRHVTVGIPSSLFILKKFGRKKERYN